jgi:ComF family protein
MMRISGGHLLTDADMVVPVPLFAWRRLRRGFNQAEDLARQLELPVCRALVRTRRTAPQSGLTAAARRRNVRNAFAIAPWGQRATRLRLEGRTILLVDDVQTTGATLEACATVLMDAGAREVRALTAARAPAPLRGWR